MYSTPPLWTKSTPISLASIDHAPCVQKKPPLVLEDEMRTQSFVKQKGLDLHNTWKDGNELAQV